MAEPAFETATPAARRSGKSADAFRTISEVADDLDVPQHVLRFWETRFAQIKPLKRAGGRRYYRPEDIELLRRIRELLYKHGYTIKGVQRLLKDHGLDQMPVPPAVQAPEPAPAPVVAPPVAAPAPVAAKPSPIHNKAPELPLFDRGKVDRGVVMATLTEMEALASLLKMRPR
ncbi:MAG: MerR family transcriptional regulator [Tagaea sp. CACIAM 22H2]|jgi:DNA-binding transcriptional MerR regulator|nr:MerR family transcriptional regulator [Tagaea sp. CACIAM 22H2]